MNPPRRATLGTWLLRLFFVSFLLALAAPVALAFAVLHLSGDTRALRNAVVDDRSAEWKKRVELNIGSLPFAAARMALPFVEIPAEAKQAMTAVRSVEFSVHELMTDEPDRARIMAEADARMSKRGWDRIVGVVDGDTAVAVYVRPEASDEGDFKIATLALTGRQMVAVTGRGKLKPVFDLAMERVNDVKLPKGMVLEGILPRR